MPDDMTPNQRAALEQELAGLDADIEDATERAERATIPTVKNVVKTQQARNETRQGVVRRLLGK